MQNYRSAPESLQLRARIQENLARARDARLAARTGDRDALEEARYYDEQVEMLRERLRSMGHRPNPTDVRLFKSLQRFDKFPAEEREGLRLALIEVVFNSVGIDHYDRRASSDALIEEYGTDERLTGKSVIDGAVPWLAQRLAKERFENQREADATLDALKRRFRKLATWAKESRQNLASFSIQEALAESENYQSFAQRKGKEESDVNPTLYRFADGWKVVELRTKQALEREGDLMSHCVGGYCAQVEAGKSRIFSLRDAENKPHVTMEYSPEKGLFKQIYGPSNEKPKEYTIPYLREFIEEKFDGDVRGLLLAGVPVDLRGADLRGVNLQGVELYGVNLEGADLRDANLNLVRTWEAKLQDADLRGAKLLIAELRSADLRHADLREAKLRDASLRYARLQDADLREAKLLDADLREAELQDADLRGAELDAMLLGATYNEKTRWPEGFDPRVAGAVFVED